MEGETVYLCDDDCANAFVRDTSLKIIEHNIIRAKDIVCDLKEGQKTLGKKWKKMKHYKHLDNHCNAEFARYLTYKALITRKPKEQIRVLKDAFIKKSELLFTELFDDDEAKEQFPATFYDTGEDLTPQHRTEYWDNMIRAWGV
jgi:hypothetical protein